MSFWGDDETPKRKVPPKILRKMVWERDKGRCRICGKKADQWNWELGHDKAHSRGGRQTLANTFVVHPFCNRSQSTKSVRELRKVLGITSKEDTLKSDLKRLTLPQLKRLAESHHISLKGTITEDLFSTSVRAPSKLKYVNALAKVVSSREVSAAASYQPERKKRRKHRESSWW
jgi:hypothetical protein